MSMTFFAGSRALPVILLLIAQLMIGAAALMARVGLDHGMSALALTVWRLLLASSVVLLLIRPGQAERELPLTANERFRLIAAGCCLALHFLTWFASLQYISVARSTLLVTTSPIVTGLLEGFLFRRRIPSAFWVGVLLAVGGAWGMTQGGIPRQHPAAGTLVVLGDLLALAGAVCIAFYFLLVQEVQQKHTTGRVIRWTYSASAVLLLPVALAVDGPTRFVPTQPLAWCAVLGMALFPQLIGHTLLNWSLKHFPARIIGAATLLEPVFAGLLAFIYFGEGITVWQGISMALVLCGVAIALFQEKQKTPSSEPST